MFVYDKEITNQLQSIISKYTYAKAIRAHNKYYYKFPFKKDYTKEVLENIVNDPKQFDNTIYKNIEQNLLKSLKKKYGDQSIVNLEKGIGAPLLEGMKFYAYKDLTEGTYIIFLVSNLLGIALKRDTDLQNYAYIFTSFKYVTQDQPGNYNEFPTLNLTLNFNFLKAKEKFKKCLTEVSGADLLIDSSLLSLNIIF